MTPERFTNLDEWSQSLAPGPCKTALRELVDYVCELTTQLESERKLVAELSEEGQGLATERDSLALQATSLKQELAETKESRREIMQDRDRLLSCADQWDECKRERDALRQRVTEAEACGAEAPRYERKRVRARSVGAMP